MRISVITVNRNDCPGLRKTIESVVAQTVAPFEFVVIDGASTDGSAELLSEYGKYISYGISEPDKGIYNAMNKGLAQAHGDYCIFMNSGDCFASADVLEKIAASGADADIICGDAVILTEPVGRKVHPEEITMKFLFESSICHQAAFIKRDLLACGFDESLKIVADRKLFLVSLVMNDCSYAHVPVDVVRYDVSGLSATHRLESELESQDVLKSLIPERILLDYGRESAGPLYGTTPYEQLFLEIGRRRWRTLVYRMVRGFLRIVSVFVPSARFVRNYRG